MVRATAILLLIFRLVPTTNDIWMAFSDAATEGDWLWEDGSCKSRSLNELDKTKNTPPIALFWHHSRPNKHAYNSSGISCLELFYDGKCVEGQDFFNLKNFTSNSVPWDISCQTLLLSEKEAQVVAEQACKSVKIVLTHIFFVWIGFALDCSS